jgi:hypothetical protein
MKTGLGTGKLDQTTADILNRQHFLGQPFGHRGPRHAEYASRFVLCECVTGQVRAFGWIVLLELA